MKKKISIILFSILLMLSNFTPVFASNTKSTPSGIPFSKMEEKIDEHVNKYIGKTTPGAAVAVVKDGKIIFSKGYGYSDIEKKLPIDPKSTVFEYGSTGKLFIWTSVMQLVEQGKLDLNKDIKSYLPLEFSSKLKYKKPITMLNIMSHTAGFEEYHFDLAYTNPKNVISLEKALLKSQPRQVYEPGSVISYSNYTSALAGYIVEQISGEKFSDYEAKHIFSPLNMKNTLANPTLNDDKKLKNIKANGYIPNKNGDFKLGNWFYPNLYPAGSVNGSLEDLAKFALALTPNPKENTPLFNQRSTLDKMLTQSYTPHKSLPSNSHGFWEFNGESPILGHAGNTAAFSTQFLIVPSEKFGVIVLTNAYAEVDIANGLATLLTEKKNKNIPAVDNKPLPSSNEVSGSYIPTRRNGNSFLELTAYISTINIKPLEENTIQVSDLASKDSYIQVEPYVYNLIESPTTNPSSKQYFSTIYFDVKDGKVQSISSGRINDFTPVPKWRSIPWLTFSIATLGLVTVYFAIAPFILLIQKIINKKKSRTFSKENTRYKRLYVGLNFCAVITLLNNFILCIRVSLNPFTPLTTLKPHLIFNWGLLLATTSIVTLLILNWKSASLSRKQKVFSIITFIFITLLMWLFINWNFFNIFI